MGFGERIGSLDYDFKPPKRLTERNELEIKIESDNEKALSDDVINHSDEDMDHRNNIMKALGDDVMNPTPEESRALNLNDEHAVETESGKGQSTL